MILYKTIAGESRAEEIINRSRFIAYARPVDSFEDGKAFVAMIREKHRDATHNVPAIVFGNKQELQWMSDDGEPQGTSGPPILKLIVDEGLTNMVIVVTRYFGGVKLGTGGLVRAYQGVAKAAIEQAGVAEVSEGIELCYDIDYSILDRIRSLSEGLFSVSDEKYTDCVNITVAAAIEDAEGVKSLFNDISSGRCKLHSEKKIEFHRKIY